MLDSKNRRINGYLWSDYTSDYFTFTLGARNDSVRIHVNHQIMWDRADDIALYIYDASGNRIGASDNDVLEDEIVEFNNLDAGVYYAMVIPKKSTWGMDPGQYCIVVETDVALLPSAELSISVDVQGFPGEIIYAPVMLENIGPDDISSMAIGVQFDPSILEPLGVGNAGLTLDQGNAQVRYARSVNTISVSMNNFSTVESGELLNLIFKIKSSASVGDESALTVLISTLNGAIVPWADGLVTVVAY